MIKFREVFRVILKRNVGDISEETHGKIYGGNPGESLREHQEESLEKNSAGFSG